MSDLRPVSFAKGRAHLPRLSPPREPGVHSKRFWTAAEKQVVRDHYPAGGVAACQPHLPGRPARLIYHQAHALGVKLRTRGGPRAPGALDKPTDDIIRAAWPELKGRGALQAFADRLGVPRWWISKQAARLGLAIPHSKQPPWTAAEDALMLKVPLHSPERVARIFREHGFARTALAIVNRAKRMALSRRKRDTFSATMAGELLGLDAKTVGLLCIAGDIEAVRRDDRRLPQQGGARWEITAVNLRRYIIDNLDRIDIRKVEKFAFVALIAGDQTLLPASGEKVAAQRPDEGPHDAGELSS